MNKWFFAALICVAIASAYALVSRGQEAADESQPSFDTRRPQRIVSLAPSITEVLYAIGEGDRVVGVTQYCRFPPEAAAKPKIGGFHDINYEVVMRLEPDLVVLIPSHRESKEHLERLGLRTLTVDQTSIDTILLSIETLGGVCGVPDRAQSLARELRREVDEITQRTATRLRPTVLLCVDRNRDSNGVNAIHIAGNSGFYHEILHSAGGVNAYDDDIIKYPLLSKEAIIRLDPEVIIETVPELDEKGWNTADLAAHWRALGDISAVKNGRVFVFGGDYVSVPGPRIARLLKDVAIALHPDLDIQRQ